MSRPSKPNDPNPNPNFSLRADDEMFLRGLIDGSEAGPAPSSTQDLSQAGAYTDPDLQEILDVVKKFSGSKWELINWVYGERMKFNTGTLQDNIEKQIIYNTTNLFLREEVVTFFYKVHEWFPDREGNPQYFERIAHLLPLIMNPRNEDIEDRAIKNITILFSGRGFEEVLQFFVENFEPIKAKVRPNRTSQKQEEDKIEILKHFFEGAATKVFERCEGYYYGTEEAKVAMSDFYGKVLKKFGGNGLESSKSSLKKNTIGEQGQSNVMWLYPPQYPQQATGSLVVAPQNSWPQGNEAVHTNVMSPQHPQQAAGSLVVAPQNPWLWGNEAVHTNVMSPQHPQQATESLAAAPMETGREDMGGPAPSPQAEADIIPDLETILARPRGPEDVEDKSTFILSIYGVDMGFCIQGPMLNNITGRKIGRILLDKQVLTFFHTKCQLFPERRISPKYFERIKYLFKPGPSSEREGLIEEIQKLSEAPDFDDLLKFFVNNFDKMSLNIEFKELSISKKILMLHCFFNVAKVIREDVGELDKKLDLEDKKDKDKVLLFFNNMMLVLDAQSPNLFYGGSLKNADPIKKDFLCEMMELYGSDAMKLHVTKSSLLDLKGALEQLEEKKKAADEPSKESKEVQEYQPSLLTMVRRIYVGIMKFTVEDRAHYAKTLFLDRRVAEVFFKIKESLAMESGLFDKILFLFPVNDLDLYGVNKNQLQRSIDTVEDLSKKEGFTEVVKIFVCNFEKIKDILHPPGRHGAAKRISMIHSFFKLAEHILEGERKFKDKALQYGVDSDFTESVNSKVSEYTAVFFESWNHTFKANAKAGITQYREEFAEFLESLSKEVVSNCEFLFLVGGIDREDADAAQALALMSYADPFNKRPRDDSLPGGQPPSKVPAGDVSAPSASVARKKGKGPAASRLTDADVASRGRLG